MGSMQSDHKLQLSLNCNLGKMFNKCIKLFFGLAILAFAPSYAITPLKTGRNYEVGKSSILEDVELPRHECEMKWNDTYKPEEECLYCNLQIRMLDYNSVFSDCDITIELLKGLQEVLDYALRVINGELLENRFAQFFGTNNDNAYCSAQRREYSSYSTCEEIVAAMHSTMCEIMEQICLLLYPDEAERCYGEMPTPPSTTPGSTTTTQPPGNPGDRECIKCLLDVIGVYSDEVREIQNCFLGAIDAMKQDHAIEVNELEYEIEKLNKNLTDSVWNIMLARIENPEFAALMFPQHYDDSHLAPYVEQVYTLGNYLNILVFGFRLPHIHQASKVYVTLINMIYLNNQEGHANIIVFMKYLVDTQTKYCAANERDCGAEFWEAKQRVTACRNIYVGVGASNIQSDTWRGLLEFGNPNVVNHVGESFKLILPELITHSCGESDFNSTLNFVKNIRWNEHRYLALRSLRNCITNRYHMLRIAYEIKNAHGNLQGPDAHKYGEVQANLMKLKGLLDTNIQVIVWDGGTFNVYGQGYLEPGKGAEAYTDTQLGTNPANNKWSFVMEKENLGENSQKRFGYRIRHQSGVYLGVPSPVRVSGVSEPLCVANIPSENWMSSMFYWEVKFFNNLGVYLYHPERRLHVGLHGLDRRGGLSVPIYLDSMR